MEIDISKRSQYNVIFRYARSGKSRLNRKKSDPVESEHVQVPCAVHGVRSMRIAMRQFFFY